MRGDFPVALRSRSLPLCGWCTRLLLTAGALLLAGLAFGVLRQERAHADSAPCTLCISQVFGGGGNKDAPYNADFIEVFNATENVIDLGSWSVEYAAAASSDWKAVALAGAASNLTPIS